MNNILKSKLTDYIKTHSSKLPYIAQKWEIKEIVSEKSTEEKIEYGHYKTVSKNSNPFYKHISTIIDISSLQ